MDVLSADEISQLSLEELCRIHTTLLERWEKLADRNVIAIGFGANIRKDRKQRGSFAVRFLVRKKRTPRRKAHQIPKRVTVRLRKTDPVRFVLVDLPTDVEEVGDIEKTGLRIKAPDSGKHTTGVVIRWLPAGFTAGDINSWQWGFLTVSHAYDGLKLPQFPVVDLPNGQQVSGEVLQRSGTSEKTDAAIITISQTVLQQLRDAGLISAVPLPAPIHVMSNDDLQRAAIDRSPGKSLRVSAPTFPNGVTFKSASFILKDFLYSGRNGRFVLHVKQAKSDAFEKGTSGSAWTVLGGQIPATVQIAGNKPDYDQGWGQSLAFIRDWARNKLNADELHVAGVF